MYTGEKTGTIERVISSYPLLGALKDCRQLMNGHINETYVFVMSDGVSYKKYILQRINEYVFKEPLKVMENIKVISQHLKGIDHNRDCQIIDFMDNRAGLNYTIIDDGCWRICPFIENSIAYETVENADILESAGYAFGRFQHLLSGIPMTQLNETIPGFHDTPGRLRNLFSVVAEDTLGRAASVDKEIDFFAKYRSLASTLADLQAKGELPLRVTHNDTKYNNILMHCETGKPLCVIDLDTVMPGLTMYDFGDAIRFAANSAAEDETDLDKIRLNMDFYEAFTRGFVGASRSFLTEQEIEHLALGAVVITIELASRFLADHINGDKYFRIHRPNHNLDRARSQITLARDMIARLDEMNGIVRKYA